MASVPNEEMPVPVTVKLSRRFYEQFGDETANELVNWFNAVDDTYRTELKELNELNFARFDAKVEQRFAESDARMARQFAEADVKLERRFAAVDAKMEQRFAVVDVKFATLRSEIHEFKSELIKWMFIFWSGTTVTLAGLLFALVRLK
jgi:hypothetical protein